LNGGVNILAIGTDCHRHLIVFKDGRGDEVAIGRLIHHIDHTPVSSGIAADLAVEHGIVGGGINQQVTLQIGRLIWLLNYLNPGSLAYVVADLQGNNLDVAGESFEPFHLVQSHFASPDDEDGLMLYINTYRKKMHGFNFLGYSISNLIIG
jgi:hypothetical protein